MRSRSSVAALVLVAGLGASASADRFDISFGFHSGRSRCAGPLYYEAYDGGLYDWGGGYVYYGYTPSVVYGRVFFPGAAYYDDFDCVSGWHLGVRAAHRYPRSYYRSTYYRRVLRLSRPYVNRSSGYRGSAVRRGYRYRAYYSRGRTYRYRRLWQPRRCYRGRVYYRHVPSRHWGFRIRYRR